MSRNQRVAVALVAAALVVGLAAPAIGGGEKQSPRLGIGLGIPYGGVGLNYETAGQAVPTLGLGYVPGGVGWNVGLRYYLKPPGTTNMNWRITAFYGVNTILDTGSEYDTRTGVSLAIGVKNAKGFDADLVIPFTNVPAGYEEAGAALKLSLGWRISG